MLSEVSVLWWTGVEFNLLAQKLAMLIVGYFLLKGIEKQNAQEWTPSASGHETFVWDMWNLFAKKTKTVILEETRPEGFE